jgi:hypothetical protein
MASDEEFLEGARENWLLCVRDAAQFARIRKDDIPEARALRLDLTIAMLVDAADLPDEFLRQIFISQLRRYRIRKRGRS